MPIQVIATYAKIPPPPVDLETAGDDIFPLCDLIVTLTAIVTPPENLQGHSVLWEQLEGTTVILDTPTEISTTYTKVINDQTDKTFRVTIDKDDQKLEQSDTVVVYATPTSISTTKYPSQPQFGTPFDVVDVLNASAQPLIPEPAGVINPSVNFIEQIIVSWDNIPNVSLQPYLTSMTLYESVFVGLDYTYTEVATILPNETFEYAGDSQIYYLRTDFVVDGMPSWGRGIQNDFRAVVSEPVHVVDDKVNDQAFSSSFNITKFSNLRYFYEDYAPSGALNSEFGIATKYINKLEVVPDDFAYTGFSTSDTLVTRDDPGGIGGG